MQIYWNMLEWKRKQLEKEEKEQMVGRVVRTTLPWSIKHIQLDLRDLMSQVSSQVSTALLTEIRSFCPPFNPHKDPGRSDTKDDTMCFALFLQMSYMKSSWTKPASPTVWSPLNAEASFKTVWDSRVEGYVILRDLDLYLTKLARDFLLLASKTHFWLKTDQLHWDPDNKYLQTKRTKEVKAELT